MFPNQKKLFSSLKGSLRMFSAVYNTRFQISRKSFFLNFESFKYLSDKHYARNKPFKNFPFACLFDVFAAQLTKSLFESADSSLQSFTALWLLSCIVFTPANSSKVASLFFFFNQKLCSQGTVKDTVKILFSKLPN